MNMKVVLLVLLTLSIIAGVPASFATPQYLTNLTEVYVDGSCLTCHVNGGSGGVRTSYGTLFENQPNHSANASAALRAIGAPQANPTPTPIATLTTAVNTVSTTATPVTTATPAASGFGIVLSIVGLLSWFILATRNNK